MDFLWRGRRKLPSPTPCSCSLAELHPDFKDNDNFAVDQLSLYYAGKIAPKLGGFVELNYDGVAQQAALNNVDIRYVSEGELLGQDVLWGITVNNNPTVQDPWNSTPAWGFPYNRSALAPTPTASTLVDGGLGQRVAGVGAYTLWNDLLYLESDIYKGLNASTLRALGQVPGDGDQTTTFVPYARVALIKGWGTRGIMRKSVPMHCPPMSSPVATRPSASPSARPTSRSMRRTSSSPIPAG